MTSSAGRSHPAYRKAREILKREAPSVCWRCGLPIDQTLHHTDRMAWTADHVVQLVECEAAGIDPNDITNLRPAHKSCNSRGGAEYVNKKTVPPRMSRKWR